MTVDNGDINWPGMYPTLDGAYQIRFTFGRVDLIIELWQVEKRTLQCTGRLTCGGLEMELEEQPHAPGPEFRRVLLTLKAPDRWWP
jgi:hypothetical protein